VAVLIYLYQLILARRFLTAITVKITTFRHVSQRKAYRGFGGIFCQYLQKANYFTKQHS